MSAEIWKRIGNFVGLGEEQPEEEFEEPVAESKTAKAPATNRIVPMPTASASEMVVLEPRSFDDALGIIDNLRSRRAVILNLQGLTPDQSQRLVDFVSGACHALDGNQERIGEAIFLFTPSNVKVSGLTGEPEWIPSAPPAQPSKELFWRVR